MNNFRRNFINITNKNKTDKKNIETLRCMHMIHKYNWFTNNSNFVSQFKKSYFHKRNNAHMKLLLKMVTGKYVLRAFDLSKIFNKHT